MIVTIILGRKGSKGLPSKNTSLILGKPSFSYAFDASKKSKYVDKTFVSTDHEIILEAAEKENFEIIKRPAFLSNDSALFEDALVHAYNEVKKRLNLTPKYIVVLMCNAITINSELIDQAIEKLENDNTADSVVTVSKFNMYSPLRARKINNDGYLDPFVPFEFFGDTNKLNCDRGSQGDVFFADMSHSVCRAECIENIHMGLLPQKWMGTKILPLENSHGCDIDEPWQVDLSIRWINNHNL